jgi:LmbE family N-acetylglucosaminyl deacetylase
LFSLWNWRRVSALAWLNKAVRIVYLSPHLDDAVLSAGGVIHAQANSGLSVEIWTVMAGISHDPESPSFAQAMHRIWGFRSVLETVEARRTEDRRAAAQVGAKAIQFDFLDCIYRRGPDGKELYSDVHVPPPPADLDLPGRIAMALSSRLLPDDQLICQLAIGRHVDHVLVRQAAEILRRPLLFDADMPYVLDHPEELQPSAAGLDESFEPVDERGLDCWLSAIECYSSQIDSVFGSRELMQERMRTYWSENRGVRFWKADSSG